MDCRGISWAEGTVPDSDNKMASEPINVTRALMAESVRGRVG